ncbi:MAG: hypothetical protein ACFE9M_08740 [Promethearchaeota archaeon]
MAKLERKVEINTSPSKIYNILNDDSLETVWNITVNESTEIGTDKYSVKTTVGDLISTITERLPDERISFAIEGGPFNKMGYILTPKGNDTEATIWAEFEDEKQEKILAIAGEMLLESLKKFAEYREAGGSIEEFDKKKAK